MTIAPGYKTYIVSAIGVLASFAYQVGWINESVYMQILGLLNALGFATLRAGVQKVENKTDVIGGS